MSITICVWKQLTDKIKTEIVISKIYELPGHGKITYEALATIHKKKHPWINAWKLHWHVSKCHKKLLPNKAASDSWITKLTQKSADDKDLNYYINNKKSSTTPPTSLKENTKSDEAHSLALCNNDSTNSNLNESLTKKSLSKY